jgi:hypothetical protein
MVSIRAGDEAVFESRRFSHTHSHRLYCTTGRMYLKILILTKFITIFTNAGVPAVVLFSCQIQHFFLWFRSGSESTLKGLSHEIKFKYIWTKITSYRSKKEMLLWWDVVIINSQAAYFRWKLSGTCKFLCGPRRFLLVHWLIFWFLLVHSSSPNIFFLNC